MGWPTAVRCQFDTVFAPSLLSLPMRHDAMHTAGITGDSEGRGKSSALTWLYGVIKRVIIVAYSP